MSQPKLSQDIQNNKLTHCNAPANVLFYDEIQYDHGSIHLQLFFNLFTKENKLNVHAFFFFSKDSFQVQLFVSLTHVSIISCGFVGLPVILKVILTLKKLSGATAGIKTQQCIFKQVFCHQSDNSKSNIEELKNCVSSTDSIRGDVMSHFILYTNKCKKHFKDKHLNQQKSIEVHSNIVFENKIMIMEQKQIWRLWRAEKCSFDANKQYTTKGNTDCATFCFT